MIKLIVLGKIKEEYLNKLIADYYKRISKYHKIEIIELKDKNDLKEEALEIKKHIDKNSYVITLEIEGKQITSRELADKIDTTFISYPNITFIIGSSEGLDNSIKEISNFPLSFSKMTIPHGLFRGLLLEQIYRAFKILNNEKYHK